jgi:hypothetical protein
MHGECRAMPKEWWVLVVCGGKVYQEESMAGEYLGNARGMPGECPGNARECPGNAQEMPGECLGESLVIKSAALYC